MANPEPNPISARTAFDWPKDVGVLGELTAAIQLQVARRRRVRLQRIAIGSSCTAALVVALLVFAHHRRPQTAQLIEPRTAHLTDGSLVETNDSASVETEFTPQERRIALTAGVALFHVAKNPLRPFVVAANGIAVRAVGTVFAVDTRGGETTVVVTEGRVYVRALDAQSEGKYVSAGYALYLPHRPADAPINTEPKAINQAEMDARLNWHFPRLRFANTPLRDAILLCNRYSGMKLTMGDDRIGDIPVSGVIRADNSEALVKLLEANFQILARPDGKSGLVLFGPRT